MTMLVGRVLLNLLGLASTLLLPWIMPAEEYGRFVSIMVLASLGAMLVELGVNWLEMRFLAPAWRKGDRQLALRIGSTTFAMRLFLDLLVTVVLGLWLSLSHGLALDAWALLWTMLWMFARFGATICASMQLPLGYRGTYVGLEVARAGLHLAAATAGFLWMALPGALLSLALTHVPLFIVSLFWLRKRLPVAPRKGSTQWLRQHLDYLGLTAISTLLSGVQLWLPVFLIGAYMDLREAAVLGVAVQVLGILHGLGNGLRQGLMPIVAEQQHRGQLARSVSWYSLLLRLMAALTTLALLAWLMIGPELLAFALPPAYGDLYQSLALMLVCVLLLNAGAFMDSLLNLRGHAAISAVNLALFAAVTLAGTGAVLVSGAQNAAWLVCAVYMLAAGVLVVSEWFSIRLIENRHFPLGRLLFLMLPGLAAMPLAWSQVAWPNWVAVPLILGYGAYVYLAGLITPTEILAIKRSLFHRPDETSRST